MTEPRDFETTDAVPPDDLTLEEEPETTTVTITGDDLVVTEEPDKP